jgi:hypothetical protein
VDTHDHVIYHDTVAPVQHGLTSNVNAVSSMPVTTRGSVVRREQCNRKPMRTLPTPRDVKDKGNKTPQKTVLIRARICVIGRVGGAGARLTVRRRPPWFALWLRGPRRPVESAERRARDKTRPHAQYCCIREFQFGLPTQKRDFLSAGERVHAPGSSRRGGLRVNRVLLDEDILPRRLRPFARP